MTTEIPLRSTKYPGFVALIDDEDAELINQYRWDVLSRNGNLYATTRIKGVPWFTSMHKILVDYPVVDHEDHNGLNNQRYNLRDGSRGGNQCNRRKSLGKSSRYKGVYKRQSGTYAAQIKVNGELIFLGTYGNEAEAGAVYNDAAIELHGEFCYLNAIRRSDLPAESTRHYIGYRSPAVRSGQYGI